MVDEQAQEVAETTAPVMPTEEQTTEETESQIPDGVSERTAEQIEKLKAHNKQLKEQLDQVTAKPTQSVLESLRPADNFPNVSQAQAAEIQEEIVDAQGFVDPSLLNQKLAEANRIAQQAIQTAQQAQQQLRNFEETQITKELYKQYPQLDPNNSEAFDPKFFRKVRNELVGQLTDGKNQDVFQAAKTVLEDSTIQVQKQVKEEEDISLKQQASSQLGASQGASSPVDHDWLVEETRKGNSDALAERLARAGY